jgi:hypothetical protein
MADDGSLSSQDLQDLRQIRSSLPPGDPRADKIDTLVGQNSPDPSQMGAGHEVAPTFTTGNNPISERTGPSGERLGGGRANSPEQLAQHRATEQTIGDTYLGTLGTAQALANPVSDVAEGAALLPTALKFGRTVLGGLGGGALGKHYAGTPGAIVGSVLGGGMAGGLEREPYTGRVPGLPMGLQRFIPDWMSPWKIPKEELERGAFMNRGYRSMGDPLNVPARVPGAQPTTDDVNLIPEPREKFEGEVPNYMASVPRDELNRLALAAKPGAGKQLQQLGKPVIYLPRGLQ